MKRARFIQSVLTAAALTLLLATGGCRRELLMETSVAWLKLNVEKEQVDGNQVESGERYEVRVYGNEDGMYRNSSFVGPTGGEVFLPAGQYHVVASRFDSPSVVLDGVEHYETLRASTRDASTFSRALFSRLATEVMTRAPEVLKTDGKIWEEFLTGTVAWEPDWFFSGGVENLYVPNRSAEDPVFTFEIDAPTIVHPCTLTVKGLGGRQYISGISCFLTGLARGVYLSTYEPDFEPVTITFNLPVTMEESDLCTGFRTFGFLPDEEEKVRLRNGAAAVKANYTETRNVLFLLITDTAGGNYLFAYDVTDQCKTADVRSVTETTDIVIVLDFTVPKPEHGGGGIAPTVSDWDIFTYEINL